MTRRIVTVEVPAQTVRVLIDTSGWDDAQVETAARETGKLAVQDLARRFTSAIKDADRVRVGAVTVEATDETELP